MVAANARKKMTVNPELNGSGSPQIVSLHSVTDKTDDRTDLFEINGKMYSISTKPRVNTALKYLHLARTQGTEIAIGYMLETLIGKDGYEALMDFDDLTQEQLEQIITIASRIMSGAVENPKGK